MIPEIIQKVHEALEDKKAVHIEVLDMKDIVSYTDYVVICSATSTTHSNALMDSVEEKLRPENKPIYRNTTKDKNWLILDYGEVVVHVFNETARHYYDLERLWGDAKKVKV